MYFGAMVVLVVGHCLVAAAAEDEKVKMLRLAIKCREENNLKPDQVDQVKRQLDTTDGNIKCFLKCIMTGMSLMNEAGDITLEGVEGDSGGAGKFLQRYVACKDVTGADPCDKALNFHNCVWSQKPPAGEEETP